MRRRSTLLAGLWLSFFFLPLLTHAQRIVSGRILSEADQNPVAGASVVIKGSKTGIFADFSFYGVADGANIVTFQKPSGLLGEDVSYTVQFSYADYYAQKLVKYDAADPAHALEQVLEQKYLAFFRNSGLEGYYQWRRTGVPAFLQGPSQSGYGNGGTIPLRFQYPLSEKNVNTTNYTNAVKSQYGGNDDINTAMWLIK